MFRFSSSKLGKALKRTTGAFRVAPSVLPSNRNFHSSTILCHKLDKMLAKEFAYEKKQLDETDGADEDYEEVKKVVLTNFKLKDTVGEGYVYLTRKFHDEHIEIQFDCQNEADAEDLSDEGDAEEILDENSPTSFGINFEVIITKNETQVVIDCVATKELQISNVQYVPKGRVQDEKELFAGPQFYNLDDDLKEEFYNYLAERGIDNEFSFFVVSQARFKEENEYRNWLEKVGKFTAK